MNVLEAKNALGSLAEKAKAVATDSTIPNNEKKSFLDQIEVDMKSASDVLALDAQIKRLTEGGSNLDEKALEANETKIKSMAEQFLESAGYKAAKASAGKTFTSAVELKTVNTINEGSSITGSFLTGLGGAGVTPQFLPGVVDIKFPTLNVAELFAQGVAESPVISYLKETAFQNNAAGDAEGTVKPQSDDTFARVNAQVGKLSHFLKITDEMIQDAPALVSFLNSRLVLGIQQKEQTELLSGAGAPSIPGVLNASGLATTINANGYSSSTTTDVDAIFQMINYIRTTAWLEPNAILVNPTDWAVIRLRKDSMGQYYSGGPFTGAYGNGGYSNVDAIWGVKVVITPAVPVGKILVGAFDTAAQIFRKQGITIEMTNSNVDDFQNGLVTVRADERLALAIYRPGAFGIVRTA